jgi:hypothetical protein
LSRRARVCRSTLAPGSLRAPCRSAPVVSRADSLQPQEIIPIAIAGIYLTRHQPDWVRRATPFVITILAGCVQLLMFKFMNDRPPAIQFMNICTTRGHIHS